MSVQKPISVLHLSAAESMLFPNLRDQLCYLRSRGYDIHTASIDGPLAHRLRDEDHFDWTPLPLTRETPFPLGRGSLRGELRARRFIEDLCRQKRFDIVHTHTPKGNVIGQWAARRAGVPVVLQTLHGFYFHDRMPVLKRRMWIWIERFSARHSDHILCQNAEDLETAVREEIIAPERITLLGNGIDLAKFEPADAERRARVRQSLNIPPDALVVGMAGRFVAEKGFPEFVAAGELLAERLPKLYLLAIGQRTTSERAAEKWSPPPHPKLGERLVVLWDRDDMPDLYASMDVNTLPSHREGFPRVLMEGAAMGLPQVCTNIRGCRQTVEDGKTGLFVPVNDATGLAAAIERLAGDAELRARFGRAARAKALAAFDQREVFEIVDRCYQRLLGTAPRK